MKKSIAILHFLLIAVLAVFAQEENLVENSSFFDESGSLRQIKNAENGFFSLSSLDETTFLVDSYDNSSVRRLYDKNMRIISKEWWNIASSAADSSILREEKMSYKGTSVIPSDKVFTDYKAKLLTESSYNEKGLPVFQKTWTFDNEKGKLLQQDSWKYDLQNRLLEYEKLDLTGKKRNLQKNVYAYTGYGDKPNFIFYENGEIRLKRFYIGIEEYTETTYFDGGFSVETSFKNGIKTETKMFQKGHLQSRTVYEE